MAIDLNNWYVNVQLEIVYEDYNSRTVAFSLNGGPWYVMIVECEEED